MKCCAVCRQRDRRYMEILMQNLCLCMQIPYMHYQNIGRGLMFSHKTKYFPRNSYGSATQYRRALQVYAARSKKYSTQPPGLCYYAIDTFLCVAGPIKSAEYTQSLRPMITQQPNQGSGWRNYGNQISTAEN